jgi:hypothetical protein
MTFGISGAAIAGLAVGAAGIGSALIGASAAKDAANTQAEAADKGIAQQDKQFEAMKKLLEPFVNAGSGAIASQQDLVGANGNVAQQSAIDAIKNSSQFNELNKQGQDAILQNASATGGLRGGNVQGALGQFSPALLNSLISEQYNRLGGIAGVGANAAAGVGNAGLQTGVNNANLLQQQGAAVAGGQLAVGAGAQNGLNSIIQGLGIYKGLGGTF